MGSIPIGLMCFGSDYEECEIATGEGYDYYNGPDGIFLCKRHYDAFVK